MVFDYIGLSFRQLRFRWLESLVVVLGIAIGAGLSVGVLGIVKSYVADRAKDGNAAYSREIYVISALNNFNLDGKAAVRIGTAATRQIWFPFNVLEEAKAACPAVKHLYSNSFSRMDVDGADMQRIWACPTTADFFAAHGLDAGCGALFSAADVENRRRVVVLGWGLARKLRAEDPLDEAIGKQISLDGSPYTLIGVLENETDAGQDGPQGANSVAYLPFTAVPGFSEDPWPHGLFSVEEAARVPQAVSQLQRYFEAKYGVDAVVVQPAASYLWDLERRMAPLLVLVSVMGLLSLLIGVVNGASISLAQVTRRSRALAITRALGASRMEVFTQHSLEAALLGAGGGLAGSACAFVLQAFVHEVLRSGKLPGSDTAGSPAWFLAAASFGLSLAAGLLFGIYPAFKAGRVRSADVLREIL